MKRWPILGRTLHELRWQIIGYGLGLAVWAFLVAIIFPSMSEQFGDFEFPEFYEAIFGDQISDIARPSTFITLEYLTWVPVVLGVYAVVGSTALLAGEETRGTADFLLTQPASRRRIYLEKAAAWLIGAVIAVLLSGTGFALALPLVDLGGEHGVGLLQFLGGSMVVLPLVSFYAALGLTLGALAPSRGGGIRGADGCVDRGLPVCVVRAARRGDRVVEILEPVLLRRNDRGVERRRSLGAPGVVDRWGAGAGHGGALGVRASRDWGWCVAAAVAVRRLRLVA